MTREGPAIFISTDKHVFFTTGKLYGDQYGELKIGNINIGLGDVEIHDGDYKNHLDVFRKEQLNRVSDLLGLESNRGSEVI